MVAKSRLRGQTVWVGVFAAYELCDLGQVIEFLCSQVPSSVK